MQRQSVRLHPCGPGINEDKGHLGGRYKSGGGATGREAEEINSTGRKQRSGEEKRGPQGRRVAQAAHPPGPHPGLSPMLPHPPSV